MKLGIPILELIYLKNKLDHPPLKLLKPLDFNPLKKSLDVLANRKHNVFYGYRIY